MSAGIRAGSSNDGYVQVNGNDIITALSGGNVGIGNTSPSTKLHVNGTVTATNFVGNIGGTPEFSGDLSIADKIIHTGDTNTAIRFPANDTVSVETSGSERLYIKSDGKIGINTTTPNSALEVQGDGGVNDATITFTRLGSPANGSVIGSNFYRIGTDSVAGMGAYRESAMDDAYLAFHTQPTGGNFTERLRITSTGKVTVKSSAANTISLALVDNDSANEIWRVGQASDGDGYVEVLEDGGTVGCKLDASGNSFTMGNFGVGVASPSTALEVKGDITVYNANNQGDIFFGEHGDVADSKALIRMDQVSTTAGELQFHTEGSGTLTKRLTITSGGQVQIPGGTTPLHVTHTGGDCAQFHRGSKYLGINADWGGNTGDSVISVSTNFVVHTNGTNERLRITSDGFIGINKDDPKTGLTISKYGTQPVVNGNTYPYPAGNWSTVWNTGTANSTDYWAGFVGGYNVSSATVNISLSPNIWNFSTQQGIYIAGEAQSTSAADFTVGKLIGGSQGGISASAGNQRATKSEMFRITSAGNVGINEASPDTKLHITHSNSTEDVIKIEASPVSAGTGERSRIIFQITQSNGQSMKMGHIASHSTGGWGGELAFHTKPANGSPNNSTSERLRITSGGHVQITSGNLEFANGAGIDFSNVPDGGRSISTDGNKFDDYEEGTWTPQVLDGNGSNYTISYDSSVTRYVKIGRVVYCWYNITRTETGSKTGNLRFYASTLPFSVTDHFHGGEYWVDHGGPTSGQGDIVGGVHYGTSNGVYWVLPTREIGTTSTAPNRYIEHGNWTNGRPIYGMFYYTTAT